MHVLAHLNFPSSPLRHPLSPVSDCVHVIREKGSEGARGRNRRVTPLRCVRASLAQRESVRLRTGLSCEYV